MYSVVVAFQVGVICKSCGRTVEIEDEYIRGVEAIEMAAALYKAVTKSFPHSGYVWERTLTCGNCGKTHNYTADDLRLHNA
jgi:Fe2+ or Zn2+ uptake regulation protein